MSREKVTVYCYQRAEGEPWHLALRTPDRVVWVWRQNTWPDTPEGRRAITEQAEWERQRCAKAFNIEAEVAWEVPEVDPEAKPVVDFIPDSRWAGSEAGRRYRMSENREGRRRRERARWN